MTASNDPRSDLQRRILEAVRRRLKKRQFETWFARASVLRLTEAEVVVGVPNSFQQEWMTKEFTGVVSQAALEITGAPVAARFEVEGGAAPRSADSPTPPPTPHDVPAPVAPAVEPIEPARHGRPAPAAAPVPPPPPDATAPLPLQPHYTFDHFVVGPSNQFAHAVARAVADHPGGENNPLFLYGSVGLGKTHLLQAICHEILRRNPTLRIGYLSCEQFTNEYVSAVQRNATEAFRARLRNVDMLVIDDIHFLANKERTQEEFFHTFNSLYHQRKPIILSSDAAPNEIPTLQERLVSRFRWGVVAQLEPPEVETRMAIVRRKAEQTGLQLPPDVVEFMATSVRNNVRELEGALASIRSRAAIEQRPIDLTLARTALEPLLRQEPTPVSIERITETVAGHFGLKLSDLRSSKRTKSVSQPRQVAMWLARELTSLSLVEIGDYFGGRDHTTVLYAVERTADRVAQHDGLRQTAERLRDRLRAR